MPSYIFWLDDCPGDAVGRIGGKAASLVALVQQGCRVPAGFAISGEGYRAWVDGNGLAAPIAELVAQPDLQLPRAARNAVAGLTPLIEAARLPESLAGKVRQRYALLQQRCGDATAVAVRSSALSEDGVAASSAGLYESFLNLRDEAAVLDAVECCYRSLWSSRAVQYRAFKQIDSLREQMGVVVMQMVPAEASGVAFTLNPITGSRDEIVINASWGLGEAIVSGCVTPDELVLRKEPLGITAREVREKTVWTAPNAAGSGTTFDEMPADKVNAAVLTEGQALDLGQVCLAIEQFYGRPQDVEWALHDGTLYVLQARPVTAG